MAAVCMRYFHSMKSINFQFQFNFFIDGGQFTSMIVAIKWSHGPLLYPLMMLL